LRFGPTGQAFERYYLASRPTLKRHISA
jgi:hypothetical protein